MSFRKEFTYSVLNVEYALEDYMCNGLWWMVEEAKKHLEMMYEIGIELGFTFEQLETLKYNIIEMFC